MTGDAVVQKIAVVTVHGTNDSTEAPDSEDAKWWEPRSRFCARLISVLAAKGFEAEIIPHKWSGANSELARERGAFDLSKQVPRYASGREGLHIVSHSHGGNVANHAAELRGWGMRGRRRFISSLTTVGTPFFKPHFGAAQYLGAIGFLLLTFASLITLGVVTFLSFQHRLAMGDPAHAEMIAVAAIFALTVIAYAFALPLAMQGARRMSRFRERLRTGEKIFSIWHPNDEAIAFLQRVERLELQPFPKGALFRGSRTPAILWSVRIVFAIVLVCLIVGAGSLLILMLANEGVIGANSWLLEHRLQRSEALTLLGVGVGGALAFFTLFYLLVRFCFGIVPEFTLRSPLNRWIGNLLRGMAFGIDTDQRLGDVSTISHSHPTIERKLDGALANTLQSNASGAAHELIAKYRWALFGVGAADNDTLAQMATDTLTWNSMIHTTYFDHNEVADMIAEHIAATQAG